MKQERAFTRLTISKKAEASVRAGHPWVYDAEVQGETDALENGSLVDAFTEKGTYLGTGFLSKRSKIRIRLLSNNANERFDDAFFARRVQYALDYRKTVMGADYENCRLIFGEADGLPGLTIDRYGCVLVSQVLSYGMELHKGTIYRLLVEQLQKDGVCVQGVFERNEAAIRELEGLPLEKGWYRAEFLPEPPSPLLEITENGIRYAVDVENGQKTGFFLDQKYNRLAVAKIARGKRVLDCFTHTGSFALNAGGGGRGARDRRGRFAAGGGSGARQRGAQQSGGADRLCLRGRVRPLTAAHRAARGVRLHHSRPARVYEEPQDDSGCGARATARSTTAL